MNNCDPSLLLFFGTCLERIVKQKDPTGRDTFLAMNGIETTLKIMATQGKDDQEFLITCLNTLAVLSVDEDAGLYIGQVSKQ